MGAHGQGRGAGRGRRTLRWTLAPLAAAGVLTLFFVLPPRPDRLEPSAWRDIAARTVAGAYHVHTTRSDGAADKDHVAEAASRAGLQFVIFTDHGDGTRVPDPPAYLHGVLCLDGVEISTDDGHYVALGMGASPYPLGGAAATVVEDVTRFGGFGVAAHPDSPKAALQWRDSAAPIDGIEWLNADSEWRNETRGALARVALGYLLRPAPALARLLDRPATLNRWDAIVRARRVVALAAHDAHGGIGRTAEDGTRRFVADVPGYEASFRTFSTRVPLDRAWSGDAASDGRALLAAIRDGRVFTTIDALAAPGLLEFYAETATGRFEMGGAAPTGVPARLVARVLAPAGAEVRIVDDSNTFRRGGVAAIGASRRFAGDGTQELHAQLGAGKGAFRVEVNLPSAPGTPPVPWLVSNPVYFLPPELPAAAPAEPPVTDVIDPASWTVEKDAASRATIGRRSPVVLEYSLRGGDRQSQYVALAAPLAKKLFGGVRVRLRADRPMRVSVQLRRADGRRWRRSVYVDASARNVIVPVARLAQVEGKWEPFDPERINSLLLVLDLVNLNPGAAGSLTVERVDLVK